MIYPIERLIVYNGIPGNTDVYWDLSKTLHDTGDYLFTLQVNRVPNMEDPEWVSVASGTNVAKLTDTQTKVNGFKLDKYYRIVLVTGEGTYLSPAEGCFGQLRREEWRLYSEMVRKEKLQHRYVSMPGVLLKRKTAGEKCPSCTTETTGSDNSACPYCFGTGYLGGYYAPMSMQCMDMSPSQKQEIHTSDNVMSFNYSVDKYQARALGIPELNVDDIWCDLSTGQRFKITASPVTAQIRRVPVVRQVELTLLPTSDVAYSIPIDANSSSDSAEALTYGCGYKMIDHNYPTTNALQYVDSSGNPVAGAKISLFLVNDSSNLPVFETTTDIKGQWSTSFMANLDTEYRIKFEKPGFVGPDYITFTAIEAELTPEEQEIAETDEKISNLDVNYRIPFWS